MSELTLCNFCHLKRIRQFAKANGLKVTILDDANWGLKGKNVYVHPLNVNIRKLPGGENGQRAVYRMAWFMEIGKTCSC